jgi:hypothetical protein
MYCKKCGRKLDDDAIFCPQCGTKVNRTYEDLSALGSQNNKSAAGFNWDVDGFPNKGKEDAESTDFNWEAINEKNNKAEIEEISGYEDLIQRDKSDSEWESGTTARIDKESLDEMIKEINGMLPSNKNSMENTTTKPVKMTFAAAICIGRTDCQPFA